MLKSQIKDQEERVKAAAPDEKQLKELEKKVKEYKKGKMFDNNKGHETFKKGVRGNGNRLEKNI